ncbi:nicotinamidase-related amidase [Lactobacillus colini]|uniref:Nicotinamidase-related amidase n=1 Tax=Lactobacillus colini TaxID=1819254 RepID=A0ABS4MF90_9LACO|nr:isochorismatase family cysteine hydrolase [Lactobacillus colini]MBP2058356.1 nicotinamidase-related amidase [Lactobacillus colini]
MTNEALLIVDYTNDFVADKGALTCGKPAQELEDQIINLANKFLKEDKWIFLPTDLHQLNDPYHPETKLFPAHNLPNTWGRKFYGRLQSWYELHQDNDHVTFIDKTRYSAFAGTRLDILLRERGIDTLHLTGVCTDICVLHTAIDAYNKNYNLIIHKKAVAALNDMGQQWALNHFKSCLGATVID